MPVGEDLAPFFSLDEHAVEAALKTPQGAAVRTVRVILSLPVGEVQVGAGEVTHLRPSLLCATSDLEGVRENYLAVIGGATYAVVRRENDGTGLTTAWLRRQ